MSIASLLAWIPFLFVALICGIIFCILGYKRGSARAGISIGVTAISSAIAIAAAKLFSLFLSGLLLPFAEKLLSKIVGFSLYNKLPTSFISELATGLSGAMFAILLYIPLFLLIASIMKPVISSVMRKHLPEPKSTANRIGGLTISLADALLYAFLLLLPLYGTLSLVGNAVDAASALLSDKSTSSETVLIEYAEAVTSPFITDVASVPPFSTAYDVLLTFKAHETEINIPRAVRDSCDLICKVAYFSSVDNKFTDKAAVTSLLDSIERFIVKNKFVTEFFCSFSSDIVPEIEIPGIGKISLEDYYTSITDGALLRNDIPAFTELAKAMTNSGMLEQIVAESPDFGKVDAEAASKAFGKTFNHSDAISAFKSKIIKTIVFDITDEYISEGKDENGAIKALRDSADAIPEIPLNEADAIREGSSLYMIMCGILTMSDNSNYGMAFGMLIEGLARHPLIGVDKVTGIADALLSASGMAGASSLKQSIFDRLSEAVEKPVGESSFPEFCDTAFKTASALTDIANGNDGTKSLETLITAKPDVIEAFKETLSDELWAELGMNSESQSINMVIDSVLNAIIEANLSEEEANREAKALNTLLYVVTSDNAGNAVTERADELIGLCAKSVIIEKALSELTEGGKSDPAGLFDSLSDNAKKNIGNKIDSYGESSALSGLKLFIGIK